MKIRFYPKADVVLAQLQRRVESTVGDLDEAKAKLSALSESKLFIQEYDKRVAQDVVDKLEADVQRLRDERDLLESHSPPEVMAEIEV